MPDNIKNNKRTDDFNKVKKNFKKLLFRMKSTKTWIFIFFVGLLAAVMIIVENVSYYFFQKNLIEIEMAQLQTSAAVMLVSSSLEMVGKIIIAATLVPWLGYAGVIVAEPIVWFIMVIPLIIQILKMIPVLEKQYGSPV